MFKRMIGWIIGDYFIYKVHLDRMGNSKLPRSLKSYAIAKRIALKYGYFWPEESK